MFRVILTLAAFTVSEEDLIIKFNIFISVIYTEAVKDSI